MHRAKAREDLMKLFYQMDICNDFSKAKQSEFFEFDPSWKQQAKYINTCVDMFISNKDEIDDKIGKAAPKWHLKSFSKIDLAILRLALCEFFYTDIPVQISVNEAVNLGKMYSNEEENKIINGILGTVVKLGKKEDLIRVESC